MIQLFPDLHRALLRLCLVFSKTDLSRKFIWTIVTKIIVYMCTTIRSLNYRYIQNTHPLEVHGTKVTPNRQLPVTKKLLFLTIKSIGFKHNCLA